VYLGAFVRTVVSMYDGRLYDIAPLPLLSTCTEGPLDAGRDITQDGMEYMFHAPVLAGLSHAVDSLATIRQLCFEDGTVPLAGLLDAVRRDWQDRETLRQMARSKVPAYGNDVDHVDELAVDIAQTFADMVRRHAASIDTRIKFPPGIGSFEFYTVLGKVLPATPDGRRSGEPISSNASPTVGRALHGQTAALNSYLKLPLTEFPLGAPIDLALNPGAGHLLVPIIKTFLEMGGNMLTVNMNDVGKMRAAIDEPEKYTDLKIRVGGYEAYFTDLPLEFQLWQIRKHEQYDS
jgi:formate C-acetyltransferase